MTIQGVPAYGLLYGFSGAVHVVVGDRGDPVPPLVQGRPYPATGDTLLLDDLRQHFCSWELSHCLGPVGSRGAALSAVFLDPVAARSSPSLPRTAVSPKLPERDTGLVSYTEVELLELDPSSTDALALSQRLAARQPGTDTWRGFSVTSPFLPGGEALMASMTSSCLAAAAEASTGSWLDLLEQHMAAAATQGTCDTGLLPPVAPPGLSKGLFGSWNMPEDLRPTEEELLEAMPATAAAQPVQQPTSAAQLLGAAAPLSTAGTAAGGASTAAGQGVGPNDYNPAGIFDGLWKIQQEAELVEFEHAEEQDSTEEDEQQQEEAVDPDTQNASSASQQVAAYPSSYHSTDVKTDYGAAGTVVEDSVDSLLKGSREAVAADKAATAALVAKPKGPQRGAGDLEFAVRGGIDDLGAAWSALLPHMALRYPFELDTFQKEAVLHLEAGRSVFVAAHTSAGKTVVAEYAFALAGAHASRAVYTSPIKTISNQKFRDFSAKFEVGLLTGDVQINPQAPCLIMTTEVLRSMLYKGADVVRDIEFVVFDEVHYVNDAERGVVWEEVIIMLPPHITIVMLSATVPNVMDFADWVGRTKNRIVYVTGTNKRPVPLEHHVYYAGELYPVMRGDSHFLPEGIKKAAAAHKRKTAPESGSKAGGRGAAAAAARPTGRGDAGGPNSAGRGAGRGAGQGRSRGSGGADNFRKRLQGGGGGGGQGGGVAERGQLTELINLLRKGDLLPVAFFTFSKKRCDAAADACSGLDLTTAAEKHTIHVFVQQVLARLKEGDRELPQILRLRDLMRRGVAVHHAGLLPIMKETVEMLFCQGYIKVLFCTETFAMGVNAPTRTVVFHSLRKHDGRSFRTLLPGEYTQMAGRAGRRGLDAVGMVVIAAWEEPPGEGELKQLLQGKGVSLSSQFRLTYSMILNLLRVEDIKVEDMLRRSFAEFHAQRAQPGKSAALAAGQARLAEYAAMAWPPCIKGCDRHQLETFVSLGHRIDDISEQLQDHLMAARTVHSQLQPGRVVLLQQPASGLSELAVVVGSPDSLDQILTAADNGRGGFGGPKRGIGAGPGSVGSSGAGNSSSGGVGPDRMLWFLILHTPGPLDLPAADTSAKAAVAAQIEEEFQGFVLKGSGGRGYAPDVPGPLPRYGSIAGLHYMIAAAPAKQIVAICKARVKLEPLDVLDEEGKGLGPALRQLHRIQEEAAAAGLHPEQLDPRQDLKLTSLEVVKLLADRTLLLGQRAQLPAQSCPGTPEQAALVRSEMLLRQRVDALNHELSDASLQQMPEFHQRVGVLQQLGYVSSDGTVTLKGRAACEINSTQDELLSTELLFRGLLSGLEPEEAVALMSALVFQEKSDVEPELPDALAAARDQLVSLACELAQLQAAAGLPVSEEDYLKEVLHPGLMEVVYEWARGTPFSAITGLTDVVEGSIVRAVVRLDQCCRELMDAARVMGDTSLFSLMEAASGKIRRDIVFAASLYVA